MTTHETLLAQYQNLQASRAALTTAGNAIDHAAYQLELELYRIEGRTHLARYAWIEAHLAGNWDEADAIMRSPQYGTELDAGSTAHPTPKDEIARLSALVAESRRVPADPPRLMAVPQPLEDVGGIPCTADAECDPARYMAQKIREGIEEGAAPDLTAEAEAQCHGV